MPNYLTSTGFHATLAEPSHIDARQLTAVLFRRPNGHLRQETDNFLLHLREAPRGWNPLPPVRQPLVSLQRQGRRHCHHGQAPGEKPRGTRYTRNHSADPQREREDHPRVHQEDVIREEVAARQAPESARSLRLAAFFNLVKC